MMNIFKKNYEMKEALLKQLTRIAESLEHTDDTHGQTIDWAQLQNLATTLKLPETKVEGDYHSLVDQLREMVSMLERIDNGISNIEREDYLKLLGRIAAALEPAVPKENELDRRKAAYALNMCLVSISQIIDYADVYILEQEYEGILNNLNLENIPKDDALLDILRQILDTITFFRIQEGDKRFIEQEYQDKMKAAIWSAVPNCAVIFTSTNPTVILSSLVYQVGTGYMNYRKEKAQAGRDREKNMWELHKAAIEQFNGLRRELFTTAWKLADRYQFDDKWRLTESLITQYNRVLMDENLNRRLVRLKEIESMFEAYPPFWYFKGHTALLLAAEAKGVTDEQNEKEMTMVAKSAYQKYFEINTDDSKLLRTDPICAACALEYASLLDVCDDKLRYIKRAIESAGTRFDIIQMCAMAYLEGEQTKEAAKLLLRLVCEGYNEDVNAHVLSAFYVSEYLNPDPKIDARQEYTRKYNELCRLTNEENLIPWPKTKGHIADQQAAFVQERRVQLLKSYANFICRYYSDKEKVFRNIDWGQGDSKSIKFIMFAKQIETELNSFPYAGVEESEFAKLMEDKKCIINKFVKEKHAPAPETYRDIFAEVFKSSAKNIHDRELLDMSDIAGIQLSLMKAMRSYIAEEKEPKNLNESAASEFDWDVLYNSDKRKSQQFIDIKKWIKDDKGGFFTSGSRHIELLVSGDPEYKRYIADYKLNDEHVVAIINDKTPVDRDLLITESGLFVLNPLIKVASFAGMELQQILKEVPYSEVEWTGRKLTKPDYFNSSVIMGTLFELIEAIKPEDETKKAIRETILNGPSSESTT